MLELMIVAIVIISIAVYVIGYAWTKSYIAGLLEYAGEWEDTSILAAIFWPPVVIGCLIRPLVIWFSDLGNRMSEKDVRTRKFRIKAEEKLRIEQQKLEEEIEKELKETLRESYK